ncbi:MAG TPA: helicase-related protein [Ktedonobacteraceae bacterium]|nr:helicase-related protein [Ktedonobacteraceae bacterium]
MGLRDHEWKPLYERDSSNLDREVLIPALSEAVSYDRKTAYFSSYTLALAGVGLKRFIDVEGRMRMIVSHVLTQDDIVAIEKGYDIRERLGGLITLALPDDKILAARLECLAWLVAAGRLDIKIALPTDEQGRLIGGKSLFHEKVMLLTDEHGDRLCLTGSVNESVNAWRDNQESLTVFSSWQGGGPYIDAHQTSFNRLWNGEAQRTLVVDFPTALRDQLIALAPEELPAKDPNEIATLSPSPISDEEQRRREGVLFSFLRDAPRFPDSGVHLALATSTVTAWPHQEQVIGTVADHYPDRYLFSDEVGLGKTIECGASLRYLIMSGRVQRVLLLVPGGVLSQWRTELREKFALPFWYYDGTLFYNPYDNTTTLASPQPWSEHDLILASSHLIRRSQRQDPLLDGPQWDLIVVDEAHHARRREKKGDRPNRLLALLRTLAERKTRSLFLLTATPMQIDLVEAWDLLRLLDLSGRWAASSDAFRDYYLALQKGVTSFNLPLLVSMMADHLASGGHVPDNVRAKIETTLSPNAYRRLLSALRRNRANDVSKLLTSQSIPLLEELFRLATPLQERMFRNSREKLRVYRMQGLLKESIANRHVVDRFLPFGSAVEATLYEEIDDYIRNYFIIEQRSSLGFVAGIYRRRLTSSLYAFVQSLKARRETLEGRKESFLNDEDDDLTNEDIAIEDVDGTGIIQQTDKKAVEAEIEKITSMLESANSIREDSKLLRFSQDLQYYLIHGHRQAIVFTQYTDTLEYIRGYLGSLFGEQLACFSGRGGEHWNATTKTWQVVTKDTIKTDFRTGTIRILLCTDAASEGLNLQSAALLFNYDMPWNPMRVEQRIGRIDRIGQPNNTVEIVNYYYEGTVEADIYRALRQRINIFEVVVGPLQPILATIGSSVEAKLLENTSMETIIDSIGAEIDRAEREGIDIEAYAASGVDHQITKHPLPFAAADIDHILRHARCVCEAGHIFTPDENRPGVYILHSPNYSNQFVTFLPEVFDRYPETVRYLTYTDEIFERFLTTAPPIDRMPGVERIECGNYISYISSMGNVETISALQEALERNEAVPAQIASSVLEQLTVRERAERATIDGINRRRVSAYRAMACDLLAAYLSLVAQDAQIPHGSSIDSRYLLSKARSQDAPVLTKLFEVAGQPNTVEIDYDDTKQANEINIASALAIRRQQAQRFLGNDVTRVPN